MDSIIVVVFALAILPYLGLPRNIDTPVVVVLVCALVYTLYRFIKQNDITFRVPLDDPDDFLNTHDVTGGSVNTEGQEGQNNSRTHED